MKDKSENDKTLVNQEVVRFHLAYDCPPTIKTFSDNLTLINKAINEINRSFGVLSNYSLGTEFAPRIVDVNHGSIVLDILIPFAKKVAFDAVSQLVAKALIESSESKDDEEKNHNETTVVIGDNNTVNIHVHNNRFYRR